MISSSWTCPTSRTYFYQCCNTYDLSNQGYCSVTIMERMLDKIVMESLKMQMQLFSDKGIAVEWCREEAAKKLKPAEERVAKIQAEIAKLEYEDLAALAREQKISLWEIRDCLETDKP